MSQWLMIVPVMISAESKLSCLNLHLKTCHHRSDSEAFRCFSFPLQVTINVKIYCELFHIQLMHLIVHFHVNMFFTNGTQQEFNSHNSNGM